MLPTMVKGVSNMADSFSDCDDADAVDGSIYLAWADAAADGGRSRPRAVDEFGTVDMRVYLSAASFVAMTVWISRCDDADVEAEVARSRLGDGAARRAQAGGEGQRRRRGAADDRRVAPSSPTVPTTTPPSVAALRAAGAVVVGKTNLDQFATGLVGHPIALRRGARQPPPRIHQRRLEFGFGGGGGHRRRPTSRSAPIPRDRDGYPQDCRASSASSRPSVSSAPTASCLRANPMTASRFSPATWRSPTARWA